MNSRERFQAIMHFKKPDRLPIWDLEGITEQAIRKWCIEGMPIGRDVYECAGFDKNVNVPLNTHPIPSFVPRVIEEDDEWSTRIDQNGFKVKTSKMQAIGPTVYYYLSGSVNSRSDWEAMKKRHDPRDIRRYPDFWGDELFEYYRTVDCPVGLSFPWGPGRSIKNGYMMGFEKFLEILSDEPDFIRDMFEFWADFIIELARELVRKTRIDYVFINEDGLAYKNSSIISPATYKKLWSPHVKKVIDFLRSHGIDIIGHYTSGNIKPLLPVLLETGFNLFAPLECAAGMDAVELRKEYGKNILLMGNISRAAMMQGKEAVEKEVYSKVPPLLESGGYIPAIDDMVLPDISFESFSHYLKIIKTMGGKNEKS